MRPSRITYAAAALMALTLAVHIILGGRDVHLPLLAAAPNGGLGAFVSILWHAVTVVLIVLTLGLCHLAAHPAPAFESAMAAIQLGFAALFLFYGATRLGTVWLMPHWVIFAGIPLLTRFGQTRSAARLPR